MLIQTGPPPRMYIADNFSDVEKNYKELIGNLVLLKNEKIVYAVCPKDKKNYSRLIEIYCGVENWEQMKEQAEHKYG